MSKKKESCIFAAVLFPVLPWIFTVILLGREACPFSKKPDIEAYAAPVAASQISWEYGEEAICAQVVLARTNLYANPDEQEEMIQNAARYIKKKHMNGERLQQYKRFQRAARETKGQVLKKNGELREMPYHALSAGKTRDGKEVLGERFSYVPSVETTKDINSPLYVEGCYFTQKELEKELKALYPGFQMGEGIVEIKSADGAGYVMEIQIGNQVFQGEQVREILKLPSSCFTIQKIEEQVRFLCKGVGHGLGMSQYTAHQMALEEKNYKEILGYFFPEMKVEDVGKETP